MDPLLETMRSIGLGGPIAAMLCPDVPALVIFGSILDDWVLEAAKLLSKQSGFTVMIQPLGDDPVKTWSSLNKSPEGNNIEGIAHTDLGHHQDSSDKIDEDQDYEEEDSTTSEEDTEGLSSQDGVFRLRGGSGKSNEKYNPQKGPVHHFDIHLEFQRRKEVVGQEPDLSEILKVSILSKIQV
jgi:hypothetical protein